METLQSYIAPVSDLARSKVDMELYARAIEVYNQGKPLEAFYLLLDHPEMGVMDCIRESKRLMNGRKGELFVLDLSFFGWLLLTAIPLVGLAVSIYVTPYIETTRAGFYLAVTGLDSRRDEGGRYGHEYERQRRYEEQYRDRDGRDPWDD